MTDTEQLSNFVDQQQLTRKVLKVWEQHCSDAQTIVMCASVEHAYHVQNILKEDCSDVICIAGLPTSQRFNWVQMFNMKRTQVLTTVRAVDGIEGGDYCIVDLKPKGKNWKPRIITADGKVYTID